MNKETMAALADEALDYPTGSNREQLWINALERLRAAGEINGNIKDIQYLVKEVSQDWFLNNTGWLQERLFEMFQSYVHRSLVRGLAVWYQKRLLEPKAPEGPGPIDELLPVDLGESGA